MKANKYISRKENKLLFIIAFITFVLAFVNFISFSIEEYNNEVEQQQNYLRKKADKELSFAVDSGQDFRPVYRLRIVILTFFIFLSILNAKNFFISTFFTTTPFLIFVYWFVDTSKNIQLNPLYMPETPYLLKIVACCDYSVFLFVSVLLFWQISILLRMLIKTLQRNPELA